MDLPLPSASRADTATSQAESESNFGRLIDTGSSEAATKISPDVADTASMVVKALESFVIPLIRAQIHGPIHNNDSDYSYLGREAQALVVAMKDFIASIVRPHLARKDEADELAEETASPVIGSLHEEEKDSEEEDSSDEIPTADGAESVEDDNFRPDEDLGMDTESEDDGEPSVEREEISRESLLQEMLDLLHHTIFNLVPIRLLSFQRDGSDIKLIERKDLWKRLSGQIQSDFDEKFAESTDSATLAHVNVNDFILPYWRYGILSHTWIQDEAGEVTYAHWVSNEFDKESSGYQKLVNFSKVAADYDVTLAWMDTICINKDSSSELDESIRSMYNWYSRASVCITYLADTTSLRDMRHDKWFTRGWTLQELLAPPYNKFYNAQWEIINSKAEHDLKNDSIVTEITAATGMLKKHLLAPLKAQLDSKMKWAAKRTVTRAEDMAYSLMGIFGVSMSTAYGEGAERAFNRLIRVILEHTPRSIPILNFGNGPAGDWTVTRRNRHQINTSSHIPFHPNQFLWAVHSDFYMPLNLSTPLTLTHLGLHISVLLMPALRCISYNSSNLFTPKGDYFANVPDTTSQAAFNLLHASVYQKSSARDAKLLTRRDIIYFGVFNFFDEERMVSLMPNNICFAKPFVFVIPKDNGRDLLVPDTLDPYVLPTPTPITFTLQQVGSTTTNTQIRIPKKDLEEKHGMFLRTLYA